MIGSLAMRKGDHDGSQAVHEVRCADVAMCHCDFESHAHEAYRRGEISQTSRGRFTRSQEIRVANNLRRWGRST